VISLGGKYHRTYLLLNGCFSPSSSPEQEKKIQLKKSVPFFPSFLIVQVLCYPPETV
jgi:hypothetical protein